MGLPANAATTGSYLKETLQDAIGDHPHVGEVRGEGLLCAVELVENRANRSFFDPAKKVGMAVVAKMLEQGVIARAMPEGDIIGLAPPLCLSKGEADQIVEVLRRSVLEAVDSA